MKSDLFSFIGRLCSPGSSVAKGIRMVEVLSASTVFRRPAIPILVVLLSLMSGLTDLESANLTTRDLRKMGFAGTYSGQMSGVVYKWNGFNYTPTPVSTFQFQLFPPPAGVVAGPSVTNGFFLNYPRVSGNERTVRVGGAYSGVSFNAEYGLFMVGSGGKYISIRKKGKRRPRFSMTISDTFYERAQAGGALYTTWSVQGAMTR